MIAASGTTEARTSWVLGSGVGTTGLVNELSKPDGGSRFVFVQALVTQERNEISNVKIVGENSYEIFLIAD